MDPAKILTLKPSIRFKISLTFISFTFIHYYYLLSVCNHFFSGTLFLTGRSLMSWYFCNKSKHSVSIGGQERVNGFIILFDMRTWPSASHFLSLWIQSRTSDRIKF